MSSYATTTDLANYCSAKVLSSSSSSQQQTALDAASSLADGYLRARFVLPITVPSKDLVRHVCNIAAYDLITQRGYNPDAGADVNWRLRYEDALSWLQGVAKGTITPALTDSSTSQAPDDPGQLGYVDDNPVVITPPKQRGW